MGLTAALAFIIPALISAWTAIASYDNQQEVIEESKNEAEKGREFSHSERVEQNEYEQQMLEYNAMNLPSLQRQGFEKAGMSTAAALQAIAGGSSSAITPTASNAPGIQATMPQPNSTYQGFQGLNDIFDNLLKETQKDVNRSEAKKNEQDVILSRQYVDESKARMDKIANDMNISNENLELAKRIADAQVNLYGSEAELNRKKLDEIDHHIKVMMAQVENLDAQTIAAYAQASLYRAETTYYNAATDVQNATVNLVNAQVEGQNIANLDANIVATLKQYRLQVSEALGVDVDADITTQIVEAMIAGRFDTVNMLWRAYETSNDVSVINRVYGTAYRSGLMGRWKGRDSDGEPVYDFGHGKTGFTPSFQPLWQPN